MKTESRGNPLLKYLLIFVLIQAFAPQASFAQSPPQKVVWKSEAQQSSSRRRIKPQFMAEMFQINGTVAAFLANPLTATKLTTAAIVFETDTFFAGYPLIVEKGSSENILALSDGGHWAFIRRSALTPVASNSELFATGKAKLKYTRRGFPLKNNGRYHNYTPACAGKNTQIRTLGSELEANVDLGVLKVSFGGSLEAKETVEFEPGVEVIFRAFGIEGTDKYIEIINYQACGRSADRGQHTYDVRINGDQLYSLDPSAISGEDTFPLDFVSKRAKITCRAHRDAYHRYLGDELGIPNEWLQIISTMTARWARGFTAFEQC